MNPQETLAVAAKRQSFGLVKEIGLAVLEERWVVFPVQGSELQDHSAVLGKPAGKVMIQPPWFNLSKKAALGPVQTSS